MDSNGRAGDVQKLSAVRPPDARDSSPLVRERPQPARVRRITRGTKIPGDLVDRMEQVRKDRGHSWDQVANITGLHLNTLRKVKKRKGTFYESTIWPIIAYSGVPQPASD
jgi:hypothetical protein